MFEIDYEEGIQIRNIGWSLSEDNGVNRKT